MWKQIDKETYMNRVRGLKPLESYTDPEGIFLFSCGIPQIITIWGIRTTNEEDDIPIVKCEMRKQNPHQKDWNIEYSQYE